MYRALHMASLWRKKYHQKPISLVIYSVSPASALQPRCPAPANKLAEHKDWRDTMMSWHFPVLVPGFHHPSHWPCPA